MRMLMGLAAIALLTNITFGFSADLGGDGEGDGGAPTPEPSPVDGNEAGDAVGEENQTGGAAADPSTEDGTESSQQGDGQAGEDPAAA